MDLSGPLWEGRAPCFSWPFLDRLRTIYDTVNVTVVPRRNPASAAACDDDLDVMAAKEGGRWREEVKKNERSILAACARLDSFYDQRPGTSHFRESSVIFSHSLQVFGTKEEQHNVKLRMAIHTYRKSEETMVSNESYDVSRRHEWHGIQSSTSTD